MAKLCHPKNQDSMDTDAPDAPGAVNTSITSSDSHQETEEQPPKKRRKANPSKPKNGQVTRKRKGARGRLAPLVTEMPMDILFEIMSHLTPGDLLSLARTTKSFRSLLLKRLSIGIWRRSFAQFDDIPECPNDLHEPQFADLLFGHGCYNCGGKHSCEVEWEFRVRWCASCRKELFLYSVEEPEPGFLSVLRRSKPRRPGGGSRQSVWKFGYYPPDIVHMLDKYHTLDRAGWNSLVGERRQTLKRLREHASKCESWLAHVYDKRIQECDDLRVSRVDSIKQRLIELGWENELEYCRHALVKLDCVKQPKALTDRMWKNISQPLVAWITEFKAKRIESARHTSLIRLYKDFLKDLGSSPEGWPTVHQVASFADFQAALHVDSDDTRDDIFKKAMANLPESIQTWRNSIRDALVAQLPADGGQLAGEAANMPEHTLTLATSVLTAQEQKPLYYLDVLLLVCVTEKELLRSTAGSDIQPWKTVTADAIHGRPLRIKFDSLGSSVVRCLLRECGLDPNTATPGDLDNLDARYHCLVCEPALRRAGMNWKRAVNSARSRPRTSPQTARSMAPAFIHRNRLRSIQRGLGREWRRQRLGL
ncbi:hypothetical protein BOTBODRAFT_569545 [Botryobasidium botryosum FD-172 SS1]|uniref:F-box domain-containing protein n=1 Tax=Botryobasidium botryosum (strain FD-172 SS1) TaxID=930990 RepID=A0A067LYP5_BOTB1|nr:hypothetical protein BOTBODRAFT_569545 [Botryobasidium botryosum FD-172 SS1]